MKKSSSEQQSRIRKQFDSFCKTLLKNEMIDYERERNYRLKYEISFSELTQKELRQLDSTYFGGAKGGANQEIFHLHLLSLFDSVCQHVT